ncbi:zinc finger protein with KRAB and SCAN domains 1-like [Thunnus albacares]|uniref:zinc finger protein with KRAB and SCAN domains 1-like n=1 Tax=Thunnus albacares TaxID=8236 RepID=UPI001CF6CBA2|nr:zinc finger protein with KRAB and SCAN domains 1-like [Thunnus albacares]
MAAEDTFDYKKVKEVILAKYEINVEVYRHRFREPDIRPNENPREFLNRLKDLYDKWIQPEKRTKEQVGEIFILEQFYCSLSPELRVWRKGIQSQHGKQLNWWRPSWQPDRGPRATT